MVRWTFADYRSPYWRKVGQEIFTLSFRQMRRLLWWRIQRLATSPLQFRFSKLIPQAVRRCRVDLVGAAVPSGFSRRRAILLSPQLRLPRRESFQLFLNARFP